MKKRAAVIDIGSNSIKALVVERGAGPFALEVLYEETLEVRISHGIGGDQPRLRPDRMEAGIEAVRKLWENCQEHEPLAGMRIVATSAVRSAENGPEFTAALESVTGIRPEVLTGNEEADAIAIGVRTDPGLGANFTDFTVFDLGGGSLELIRFEAGKVTACASLPLGSVRLTEQFLEDPEQALSEEQETAVADHLRKVINASGIPVKAPLIGCGGGIAAVRRMLAAKTGRTMPRHAVFLERSFLDALETEAAGDDLQARLAIPGMPPERADIFPAAFITFMVLIELAGAGGIHQSLHNLRYGLAFRMLEPTA